MRPFILLTVIVLQCLARLAIGQNCTELPDLPTLLELAFPTWNVGETAGERVAGGGKWNPLYYTKRYDGLDPALGGYPTDIDVGCKFYCG
jgi:hypothetical protein